VIIGGNVVGFALIGIALFITHRESAARSRAEESLRESEALFRGAAEASLDAFYVLKSVRDVNGKIADFKFIDANERGAQMVSIPRDKLIGQNLCELLPINRTAGFFDKYAVVVETGQPYEEELQLNNSSINANWVRYQVVPVGDGIAITSRDISSRKKAEAKLRAFARQLQEKNSELQGFAYVASHDLQEPLRKIQAFGDRLETKAAARLNDQERDYLARMRGAAKRMQGLIEALLSYSRVTSTASTFEQIDVGEVLESVLQDLEIRIEQNAEKVNVGPMPTLDGDVIQLRQLFQNIIGNSLKYHRPGVPPVVTVKAEQASEGDSCVITISDNGIGFEPKYAETIFGVFQRLHGREEYEGTGVGLAICRKIIERHSGTIRAEGKLGVGAIFIISLPLNQSEQTDLESPANVS
ncbi:MAG TPA: ATP-binding protein, partial [Opitutaceae bacterium]|nr:ATP-binding protein [Opitutaceae bacterium]